MLFVFVFVFSIGYFLIRRVPSLLHTPLMSMTNAISGVTLVGAILLFTVKAAVDGKVLGSLAILMSVFNLFGGFVVTARMLKMFQKKKDVL
jgi:NAD(P) transhydrogenase subunit alpha